MSIMWNKCKRKIKIGLDSRIDFIKLQSNDRRVCWMRKKDSPKSWQ